MSSFIIKLKGKKEIKILTTFDTSIERKHNFFMVLQRKSQSWFAKEKIIIYMFPINELEYFCNPDRVDMK